MIILQKTCNACPEQYDAYLDGERVGYLRLRHGRFTVECPDAMEALVYSAYPLGDGEFTDEERDYFLRYAVDAIEKWIAAGRPDHKTVAKINAQAPNVAYQIEDRCHDKNVR